jgi:two-component system, cell cycle sensor histidine kinase and response regulator CckA
LARDQFPADAQRWVAVVDASGTIHSLDGAWSSLVGPAKGSATSVGSSYFRFLAVICPRKPERVAALSAGIRAVAAGREDSFSMEFPCRTSLGDMRMRVVATPSREAGGEGVLLVHTDAGTSKDVQLERRPQPDTQAPKMEALGRLTSGVAHDFANLLTLISGYSEILLGRMSQQDPLRSELEEIRRAALGGAGVTAKILDFIRSQTAQPGLINLNTVVADLEKLLRPIIGEHIDLVTALSPGLGSIKADREEMTRVVLNLVLNARDAMPSGGRILIQTANLHLGPDTLNELDAGDYVTLTLTDAGVGMDEETMSHLFEPFFTTKRATHGTGLGLHTVSTIVKRSSGNIRVSSEQGKGSTFTISLPRVNGPAPRVEGSAYRPLKTGTETILLVEDEDGVRKLMNQVLTMRGYKVLEAANGPEALRIFEQAPSSIDLLLTDIVMPGMSGRELAETILTHTPQLKVIYVSGYTDDMLSNTGALRPGMSFLRKPLLPDTLITHIREVLDGPPRR